MKIELIERLIKLAERSGLSELEYSQDNSVVRFSFGSTDTAAQGPSTQSIPVAPAVAGAPLAPLASPNGHAVKSSLGGTFYRGSAPEEPPFVQVGDRVEEGQTLAIIEAMKMLNPIESPIAGRVLDILIEDASLVESGSPLFMISEEG